MHSSSLVATLLTLGFVQAATISKDARCGTNYNSASCLGSSFGDCCSQYNFCGSGANYCSPSNGCQSKFGKCDTVSSSKAASPSATRASTPAASPTQSVSKDGQCGTSSGGKTCKGSSFGSCCSQYGYCGSTAAYCGSQSCQKGYGDCTVSVSSAIPSPSTTSTRPSSTTAAAPAFTGLACNVQGSVKDGVTGYKEEEHLTQEACMANCRADSKCLATKWYSYFSPTNGHGGTICDYYDQPASAIYTPAQISYVDRVSDKACELPICNMAGGVRAGVSPYKADKQISQSDCLTNCKADSQCKSTTYNFSLSNAGVRSSTCSYYNLRINAISGPMDDSILNDQACGMPGTPDPNPNPICNAKGDEQADLSYWETESNIDLATCLKNCRGKDYCQTIAFTTTSPGNTRCDYYGQFLQNVAALGAGNFVWYDVHCEGK